MKPTIGLPTISSLQDEIARLEAENARLKEAQEWHYSPELPELHVNVVADFSDTGTDLRIAFYGNYGWVTQSPGGDAFKTESDPKRWRVIKLA